MTPFRAGACAAAVALLMPAGGAPGLAQAPGPARAPAVTIDAAAPLEPMSTVVYGQLIEHPGRGLPGGIWAEMLDDRKFFHPVAEGESPWSILGGPRSTAMITARAFVGEHSPEFEVDGTSGPAGLSQAGLGIVAGSRYTGRVLIAGGSQAGPIEVSLVWGAGPSGRQTVTIKTFDERFRPFPIAFTAAVSTDEARLEIAGRGKGRFRIGGRRLRDNGPRAEALPRALRPGAGRRHRGARTAGCRGRVARRPLLTHARHRQSDGRGAGDGVDSQGGGVRAISGSEENRGDRSEGV